MGGILGKELAPNETYATLPLALLITGIALTALFAARIMAHKGRKFGFLLSQILALVSSGLGALAVIYQSFLLFLMATFCFGVGLCFIQQVRFAAVETLNQPADAPKVLSLVMLTSILSGFIGPEVVFRLQHTWDALPFLGSFIGLAGLSVLSLCVFLLYREPSKTPKAESHQHKSSILDILKQPNIALAIAASAIGYSVMSYIMTATPNSMHDIHHHSLKDTKWVIQSHILAMYLPSLVTGYFIGKFGSHKMIILGALLYLATIAIGLSGVHIGHFFFSLVLLGVGWNLLFVAGTTLLTQSYQKAQRFQAQAINDTLTFGLQAFASLAAGWVLFQIGWQWVLLSTLPFIIWVGVWPLVGLVSQRRTEV